MHSPPWLVVARREFTERVRTKWFVAVTLLGPIGMIALVVLPVWLGTKQAEEEVHVQVVDDSGRNMASKLQAAATLLHVEWKFDDVTSQHPDLDQLRERLRGGQIDGIILVPADYMTSGKVTYRGVNASSTMIGRTLQGVIDYSLRFERLHEAGLGAVTSAEILAPADIEMLQDMGEAAAQSGSGTFIIGYAVMFILYMAVLLYAVNVLRSVIQEKTSRVVEIMVSAVKPRALMLGKIIGVGSVGLLQLGIWATIALLLIRFRGAVLGLFGFPGAGDVSVPSVTAPAMALVLIYFLLGYFFYASLYAAIGAMTNSEQEAQQAQTPVVLLLIIPVVCVELVASNPRGGVAELLTLIPFSSPVLMPMRYLLGGAGLGDVLLSLAILVAATAGAVWLAARIYRVGILMYGKRPSLRELARWVRHG